MWKCANCKHMNDDAFKVCELCSTSIYGGPLTPFPFGRDHTASIFETPTINISSQPEASVPVAVSTLETYHKPILQHLGVVIEEAIVQIKDNTVKNNSFVNQMADQRTHLFDSLQKETAARGGNLILGIRFQTLKLDLGVDSYLLTVSGTAVLVDSLN